MAANPIPSNSSQLIGLGNKMIAGLTSLGSSLGITQITPAALQLLMTSFVTADGSYNEARSATLAASDGYKLAMDGLSSWLAAARSVLVGHFGSRWSTQWAQAGFISPTTAVPARIEDRISLTLLLKNFLTAQPSYEAASLAMTASDAQALYDMTFSAQQTYISAIRAQDGARLADEAAREALVVKMRLLIGILKSLLPGGDARWMAFGLNMPAANTTPGQPLQVTVTLDLNGNVVAECDELSMCERYRWRMRIVGQQPEYSLVATTTAPMTMIKSVLPGQTVELIVQGVNGGAQGVASVPVLFTKPALAPIAEAMPVATQQEPEVKGFTNRGGNGNGHGHAAKARAA